MDAISWIAEQKISTAVSEGLLDDLPGKGEPLNPEFMDSVGPEQAVYSILSNSGFLPKSLALRKEIEELCAEKDALFAKCETRLKHIYAQVGLTSSQMDLQFRKCILFFRQRLISCVKDLNSKVKKLNAEIIQQEIFRKSSFSARREFTALDLEYDVRVFNQKFNQMFK